MTATKLFDFLVPVNPIVALKNLIPDLVFHYQSLNSKILLIKCTMKWASFGGRNYEATDLYDPHIASTRLAKQILNSFILSPQSVSTSILPTKHCARLLEGLNNTIYIVGQQRNVQQQKGPASYVLNELNSELITMIAALNTGSNHVATGKKYYNLIKITFLFNSSLFQ